MALVNIELDRQGTEPLFQQIYDGLREAILTGQIESGTRLPPTRDLAQELSVSRNTIVNAFEQLIAEGYLEGKVGAGTYVAGVLPEDLLHARKTLRPTSGYRDTQHSPAISRRGTLLTERSIMPIRYADTPRAFQPGLPAVDRFPFEIWSKLSARYWRNPPLSLLRYGDPQGYRPLREAIVSYLKATRGVRCEAEQVIVVSGSQQALDLAARILLDPGDTVYFEDPGYLGARHVFTSAGGGLIPVVVDEEGMNVEAAISQARTQRQQARLVYVSPSHQYPMGVSLSLARRFKLLEWAAQTGMWVLEDDYDSEFRYSGRPLPALQGLDSDGRVIYMGSFSKALLPSLRLGYLVVPPSLVDTFVKARALSDRHSPSIDQAILGAFIEEGHFTRHVRRMRQLYHERQVSLLEAGRMHLGGLLDIVPSQTGMHVVGWLARGIDDHLASQQALKHNIDTPPLSSYWLSSPQRQGLILGYTGIDTDAIQAGVKRLARALESVEQTARIAR
jgi:GntR family transcriptional regulator/MocR family aminotransferase